jgi:hypothetical protein
MSRLEISGYIQIVIGIVGIVVTVLTAPAMLDALGNVGGKGALPPEFAGVGGAIRIFSVLFVLIVMILVVLLGLSITISTLAKALGACHPLAVALCTTLGASALAVTITLGVIGSSLWIPGFVGFLGLALCSLTACRDNEKLESTTITAGIFVVLFLITGAINRGSVAAAGPPVTANYTG